MARHSVKVLEIVRRCADVISLRLERPESYSFAAGQYLLLALETADGRQTKPFTHSSAPRDPYLEITTRLSGSAFKQTLARLVPGDLLDLAGPAGRFEVPPDEQRVAFLVGGVGITPAVSMLRGWEAEEGAAPEVVLFYGNRDGSCIPFAEELSRLKLSAVEVIHFLEVAHEGWSGRTGFITPQIVGGRIEHVEEWLFVVAGPQAMVDAMEYVLDVLDVPADRRLVERFGAA